MSEASPQRRFTVDGVEWVAWQSGAGAIGTGACGLGRVGALHFALADAPDRPVREVLLPGGKFEDLFDQELAELLRRATPIAPPDSRKP